MMGLNIEEEAQKGADWMGKRLKIENMPKIVISYDTEEAQEGHHTGKHEMGSDEIWVYGNRNLIDIMRTVFHEPCAYSPRGKGFNKSRR